MTVLRALVGPHPRTRTVASVGALLAALVRREHAFTPGYLYNILATPQRQEIGLPLRMALRAYWEHENGGNAIIGAFEPLGVKAVPGNVEPGALILAKSRRCGNPRCQVPFVPAAHNQAYCNPLCKKEARSLREKKEGHSESR
jgi:hypothetical protein